MKPVEARPPSVTRRRGCGRARAPSAATRAGRRTSGDTEKSPARRGESRTGSGGEAGAQDGERRTWCLRAALGSRHLGPPVAVAARVKASWPAPHEAGRGPGGRVLPESWYGTGDCASGGRNAPPATNRDLGWQRQCLPRPARHQTVVSRGNSRRFRKGRLVPSCPCDLPGGLVAWQSKIRHRT